MKLTLRDLLHIRHSAAIGTENPKKFVVTGVSTDSRKTRPGDVFIAIRGDQFDGHNFLTKALEAGAAAVVVEKRWADANASMMISIRQLRIVVENSVTALGELATTYRRKFSIPVVAVGGSNGKTTTKDMITAVLATKYAVLATEGNLNNQFGVPQTLFRLEKKHQIAVLEMGTNHPGEIETLCRIAEPTHGLLTNIGREHLEFFGSLQGVARAEGELFAWLKENGGEILVNDSDARIRTLGKRARKRTTYGWSTGRLDVGGRFRGLNVRGCATVRVKPKGKRAFDVELSVPGEHNAANALAAAAVGLSFRIPVASIRQALLRFSASSKRMQVQNLNGIVILNDTYNANPDSVLAALETVAAMKGRGKKIAVLADMLELGSTSDEEHRRIGKAVGKYGVDTLLTYGERAALIGETAAVPSKLHFAQKAELADHLAGLLAEGDIVLIKGSRGMKMEEIIASLSERFHKAA